MGVQSRRRKLQHALREAALAAKGNPSPTPLSPEEQKARYFANWVDGHPPPKYKQTNTGGHEGPKTYAPPRTPRFVQEKPFIRIPVVNLLGDKLKGWFHSMRRRRSSSRTGRVRAGRAK